MKEQILFIVIILLVIILALVLTKIRTEFELDCNSGDIDMNYSGVWLNQTDFLNEFIEIKGIDGLNCKVKGKVDVPWWLILIR